MSVEQRGQTWRACMCVCVQAFVVNIAFGSARPSRDDVEVVLGCLSESEFVHLRNIFESAAQDAQYGLRGFVCYRHVRALGCGSAVVHSRTCLTVNNNAVLCTTYLSSTMAPR
jgi:hypothetical protein